MNSPEARSPTLGGRSNFTQKLLGVKQRVAEAVTDEFFKRHPDWLARYGERGRIRGIEDACFHIDHLAGAIDGSSIARFEAYALWTARTLQSRGIEPHFVAENLKQIDLAFRPYLSAEECEAVGTVLDAGRAACLRPPEPATETESVLLGVSQKLFLQAILAGRRQEAVRFAIEALRQGHTVIDIYVELFETSLYKVGRLWEANQITVAEEHMATAITQHAIAQLYAQLTPVEAERGRIVLTGVQGEHHQVGAAIVADVREADGWDVRFLGTNMPYAGILQAIEAHQADILGISATMLFCVPQVRQLIGEVRSRFGPRSPRIVLGGAALAQLPELAAEVGAVVSSTDLRGVGNWMQTAIAAGTYP